MPRDYSSKDKAVALAALDANGGALRKTAKALNVPKSTLEEWKNNRINPEVSALRTQEKSKLADAIESVCWEIVGSMPEKIDKAGLKDSAIALGTGIDKFRLLREQPTSISAGVESTERIAKVIAAASERDGQSATEAEANLQLRFSNPDDAAYDPSLDPTKNPAVWPSGNLLTDKDLQPATESVS